MLRITAHNSATESENRIHSDDTARVYGYRSGLVPGVAVYGYMMQTVTELPRALQVRLLKPVFDGDELLIRRDGDLITAEREDEICARILIGGEFEHQWQIIPEASLPNRDQRAHATAATLVPGLILGTLRKRLDDGKPESTLELANHVLLENFRLDPWLHVSSEIAFLAPVTAGDPHAALSRIHDRYEKKGREFVVLDVLLVKDSQPVQSIRHTAIYKVGGNSPPHN